MLGMSLSLNVMEKRSQMSDSRGLPVPHHCLTHDNSEHGHQ